MEMTPKQLEKWAKTRLYGVVGWGLTIGVLWSLVMSYGLGWNQLLLNLVLAVILFPIGGYFFGHWMWKKGEEGFQKANPND